MYIISYWRLQGAHSFSAQSTYFADSRASESKFYPTMKEITRICSSTFAYATVLQHIALYLGLCHTWSPWCDSVEEHRRALADGMHCNFQRSMSCHLVGPLGGIQENLQNLKFFGDLIVSFILDQHVVENEITGQSPSLTWLICTALCMTSSTGRMSWKPEPWCSSDMLSWAKPPNWSTGQSWNGHVKVLSLKASYFWSELK